jgi:Ca2+-binding EF-hand superfamily protein
MKDFLLTLIAFKRDESPVDTIPTDQIMSAIDDQCSLYFHLFDIDDTGFIDLDELKVMVQILFKDQKIPGVQNSEELFTVVDLDQNGKICYEEFKKFYASVLTQTMS